MMREKKGYKLPRIDVLPLVDCVFQLIIFFVVCIKSEQRLDDILQLPKAYKAVVQEEDKLEIYILKAKILKDGSIDPDSTGLIAFAPKEPEPGSPDGLEKRFVDLDEVGPRLERERERVLGMKIQEVNYTREKAGQAKLSPEEIKEIKEKIPLMIKADNHTFYGRILQVVAKARAAGINQFALVTNADYSEEMVGRQAAAEARAQKK